MINPERYAPRRGVPAMTPEQFELLHCYIRDERLPDTWRAALDAITLADWVSHRRMRNALSETERLYSRMGLEP